MERLIKPLLRPLLRGDVEATRLRRSLARLRRAKHRWI